jgi:anti-anti-sigma regulatory factor
MTGQHLDIVLADYTKETELGPLYDAVQEVKGRNVRVDAGGVDAIGTLLLQLLLGVKLETTSSGGAFTVTNLNDCLQTNLSLLGADLGRNTEKEPS